MSLGFHCNDCIANGLGKEGAAEWLFFSCKRVNQRGATTTSVSSHSLARPSVPMDTARRAMYVTLPNCSCL